MHQWGCVKVHGITLTLHSCNACEHHSPQITIFKPSTFIGNSKVSHSYNFDSVMVMLSGPFS